MRAHVDSRRKKRALVFSALLAVLASALHSFGDTQSQLMHAEMETDLVPSPAKFDVLLPPNYESIQEPLPVLLWLHGGSNGKNHIERRLRTHIESAWNDGILSPLVVIAPITGNSYYIDWKDGTQNWEEFITGELISNVRGQFNVQADRAGTVIAGASAGGQGTLRIAFRNPEKFVAAVAMEPGFEPVLQFQDVDLSRFPGDTANRFLHPRFGQPVDAEYWAERHPPAIVVRHASKIRDSNLQIRIEAGDEDANLTWLSAELIHRLLFDAGIRHEFYIEYGAAHTGRSLPRRLHDSFAFMERALHPEGPDPEALRHLEGAKKNGRYKPRIPNQLTYESIDFSTE